MPDATLSNSHAEFVQYIVPILDVLKEKGGSATIREAFEYVAGKLNVSEEALADRHEKSGELVFNNRVRWAKQYLAWEGLVETSKQGVWSLTDKGWNSVLSYDDAYALVQKWVKIKRELRLAKKQSKANKNVLAEEPNEYEEEGNVLALIDILRNVNPIGFEHLCGRLLREYDFEDIEITRRSNDGGIDGYAKLRINPFVNMSVFFQCKRYSGVVPIGDIRDFVGTLQINKRSVEKALFITTGSFSVNALEIASGMTELELIDGDKLVEMFEQAELGVTPRTVYEPDITFFEKYMGEEND
jgi:restriction system protein